MSLSADNVSKKLNGEQKIWRYMSLDKLINLLDTGKLFFTPLSAYAQSDPFEGLIPRVGLDAIGKYLKMSHEKLSLSYDTVLKHISSGALSEFPVPDKVRDELAALKKQISEHPSSMADIYFNIMESTVVNCWHQNDAESEAMWKLYSDENKGIAVQTTVAALAESISDEKSERIFFGAVRYIDFESPELRTQDCVVDGNLGVLLKRTSFQHENEARLYFIPEKNYLDISASCPTPQTVGVDVHTLIQKVYISPYASEPFPGSVACILKMFGIEDDKIIRSQLLQPGDHLRRIF